MFSDIERLVALVGVAGSIGLIVAAGIYLYMRGNSKIQEARAYAEKVEADTRQKMDGIAVEAISTSRVSQAQLNELYERFSVKLEEAGVMQGKQQMLDAAYEDVLRRLTNAEQMREADRKAFGEREREMDKRYHALQEENKALLRELADMRVEQTKLVNLVESERSNREPLRLELEKQVQINAQLAQEKNELRIELDNLQRRVDDLEQKQIANEETPEEITT